MQNKNLKIKVFGIGNGGQNIVDYLYLNNKSKISNNLFVFSMI